MLKNYYSHRVIYEEFHQRAAIAQDNIIREYVEISLKQNPSS